MECDGFDTGIECPDCGQKSDHDEWHQMHEGYICPACSALIDGDDFPESVPVDLFHPGPGPGWA